MERTAFNKFFRFSLAAVTLGSSLMLGACGGGAGGGSGTTGQSTFVPGGSSSLPQAVACTSGCSAMTVTGQITALSSSGFYVNTGSTHGTLMVFTTASTTINGPSPFVGENITASGTGSWSTSLTATSVSQTTTSTPPSVTPTMAPITVSSPIPVPSGVVSTHGSVAGQRTGGFTLNQGSPNGLIPVTVPASATLFGGTETTGSYVQVTGTGSVHSGITATVVSTFASAPASITATGTIVAGTPYGFTLNVDASHPAVPVILTSAAVIAGGQLLVGSTAQVTGPGDISNSITPVQIVVSNPTPAPVVGSTPIPTPGPIAQTHLLTGDYLGGYYGTHNVAWGSAAPYLTWAQTGVTDANAISSTGIKTQFYTIPTRVAVGDPMYTSDETTFAHDCSSNRVTTVFGTSTQYVTDVNSSSLRNLYTSKVTQQIGSAHFDAVFEDDAGPLSAYGLATLPCNYSDSAWIAGGQALNDAAPRPVIFNGLSSFNGHDVSQSIALLSTSNTIGGNLEHCYSDNAIPEQNAWAWVAMENTELQVGAQGKLFECMLRNTSSGATAQQARTYALASFLLTYNPQTSIFWEEFATPSGFHVEPESQLVALNPVVAQPGSVSALQTSSGAYGREYRNCYYAGNYVGPCAVAVNSDTSVQHLFPYPQYTHTLVLNGAGVLDGGTAAFNGPAAPMYMQPETAVVAFQ